MRFLSYSTRSLSPGTARDVWTPRGEQKNSSPPYSRYSSYFFSATTCWRNFMRAFAQIWEHFRRHFSACGNLSLLAPHFRLFQWGLSVPQRLASRAVARLARHLVRPLISHLRMNKNWSYKYGKYGHERSNTVRQSASGSCSICSGYTQWNITHPSCGSREKVYKKYKSVHLFFVPLDQCFSNCGPRTTSGPCGPLRLNISPKKTEKIKFTWTAYLTQVPKSTWCMCLSQT
jgi:hypothetical protein